MKNFKHKIRLLIFALIIFNSMSFANTISTSSIIKKYSQKEIHPLEDDYFGEGHRNTRAIFSVDVSNDKERCDKMAITFDSAYINKYTYQILDVLDEYNYRATFFMTNDFIVKNKEQVKEILKRGHEIGNHSTTHPDFRKLTEEQMIKQIKKCEETFYNITGVKMSLFRFPYGAYNETALNVVKDLGYFPIQWTLDSVDWRNYLPETLLKRIKNNGDKINAGSIILFHNGADPTPEALPQIIEYIESRGLRLCKVSDLIYEKDFKVGKKGLMYKKVATESSIATKNNIN